MQSAALALLNGYADPLGMLTLHPHDWTVSIAVVRTAEKFRAEQRKSELDYLADRIASSVARMLG